MTTLAQPAQMMVLLPGEPSEGNPVSVLRRSGSAGGLLASSI
jgi:hypothetical protein